MVEINTCKDFITVHICVLLMLTLDRTKVGFFKEYLDYLPRFDSPKLYFKIHGLEILEYFIRNRYKAWIQA